MSRNSLIVLKLGGSVLTSEEEIGVAVAEIRRWTSKGRRVLAVVSAFEGTTDKLLARARSHGGDPWATAALVATGELSSAAVLSLALNAAGIRAATLDAAAIGLRTSDDPLDAGALDADLGAIEQALTESQVLVVPGFVGRDSRQRTTLLGRGGSDLTALFLAGKLRSACRLVKDVPGLFDRDPKTGPARLYHQLAWDDALKLDGGIVQHKGVRFAKAIGLEFEVGALGAEFATRVGDCEALFAPAASAAEIESKPGTEVAA